MNITRFSGRDFRSNVWHISHKDLQVIQELKEGYYDQRRTLVNRLLEHDAGFSTKIISSYEFHFTQHGFLIKKKIDLFKDRKILESLQNIIIPTILGLFGVVFEVVAT